MGFCTQRSGAYAGSRRACLPVSHFQTLTKGHLVNRFMLPRVRNHRSGSFSRLRIHGTSSGLGANSRDGAPSPRSISIP